MSDSFHVERVQFHVDVAIRFFLADLFFFFFFPLLIPDVCFGIFNHSQLHVVSLNAVHNNIVLVLQGCFVSSGPIPPG
jgi:hypothetical protein